MTDEVTARPLDPLADPLTPLTVLYDGECPFCRWTANRLRRWDRDGNLRIRPFQETREQPVLHDLLEGFDLGRSIHVVDSAGRFATGGNAFLAIVSVLPSGRPVAAVIAAVWPWRIVVGVAYRIVARVRPFLSSVGFNGPIVRERNLLFDPPPPLEDLDLDEDLVLSED